MFHERKGGKRARSRFFPGFKGKRLSCGGGKHLVIVQIAALSSLMNPREPGS
jgi:hypothetical protein